MVDISPPGENEHLRIGQALVHFSRHPERRKDICIPNCEEGRKRDPVKPVQSIMIFAGSALCFKGMQRHVIFFCLMMALDHFSKLFSVIGC